jgi:hypothetical protein
MIGVGAGFRGMRRSALAGAGLLIIGETNALAFDFTHTNFAKQMRITTAGAAVDSDPYSLLTYTSPSVKMCRQSDGTLKYGNHNLILQSQVLDNASWTKSETTISANAATAPDGTLTADKVQENTNSALHQASQTFTVLANKQYQVSCFLKAAERTTTQMYVEGGSSWYGRQISLVDGSFASAATASGSEVTMVSHTVTSIGNGWFHNAILVSTTLTTLQITLRSALSGGGEFGVGVTGEGFYAWGAQARYYPSATASPLSDYLVTTSATKFALPYEWNASGVLQGIRAEEARTNLVVRSQEFGNGSWVAPSFGTLPTITSNSTTAPDGTTTADTLNDTNAASFQGITQAITVVDASVYCASVYVLKDATPRATRFGLLRWQSNTGSTSFDCCFDTATGETSSALGVNPTPVAMGAIDCGLYWRFYIAGAASGTAGEFYLFPAVGASNFAAYVNTATGSAKFWGAQLELGSYPSTPIHTVAATATRAIDNIWLATSAFPFSATAGTLFGQATSPSVLGSNRTYVSLTNGSDFNESIYLYEDPDDPSFLVFDGGVSQASIDVGTAVAATSKKLAAAWAANDFAASFDGGSVGTDSSGSLPTPTRITIGGGETGAGGVIYIEKISYLARRATNSQLMNLTGGTSYSTEANNYFTRLATQPSTARKVLYDAMITSLVAGGVWSKLDALYLFAAASSATALINLKSASYPCTAVNSPTFTADAGYSLTGASSHRVKTSFNPSTAGGNQTQDSAHISAWCNTAQPTSPDGGGLIMGWEEVGPSLNNQSIYARAYPDHQLAKVNGTNYLDAGFALTDARGLHLVTRTASSTTAMYFNGALQFGVTDDPHTAVQNANLTFGATQTAERFTGVVLGGSIGSGLTAAEALTLYTAMHTYLQAVAGVA